MNCELNESHNWYESDYSDDMEIETLEPAWLVDDYVYPHNDRRTLQERIVSSYSEHFVGESISLPPEAVRMDEAHFRLSRENVEDACDLALAFLGITDYRPRETLGLKWSSKKNSFSSCVGHLMLRLRQDIPEAHINICPHPA